jgi:hypothetical protein
MAFWKQRVNRVAFSASQLGRRLRCSRRGHAMLLSAPGGSFGGGGTRPPLTEHRRRMASPATESVADQHRRRSRQSSALKRAACREGRECRQGQLRNSRRALSVHRRSKTARPAHSTRSPNAPHGWTGSSLYPDIGVFVRPPFRQGVSRNWRHLNRSPTPLRRRLHWCLDIEWRVTPIYQAETRTGKSVNCVCCPAIRRQWNQARRHPTLPSLPRQR